MPARYEVYLANDDGEIVADLMPNLGFEYLRVVNDRGVWSLTLEHDALDDALVKQDQMIHIWRALPGARLRLDFVGFLRHWFYTEHTLTLAGYCLNDLLRRRVIPAVQTEVVKTDYADDLMKELVYDNLGAGAGAGRDLSAYGFTVEADASIGPTVVAPVARYDVLSSLQELADIARGEGAEVFFGIEFTEPSVYTFCTDTDQPGIDRTWGNGMVPPVVLRQEEGTLEEPLYEHDHSDEGNFAYALGPAEGDFRPIQTAENTTLSRASNWARCEVMENAPDAVTTAALSDAASRALIDHRPRIRLSGRVAETENLRYGRDWNFGDKVTVAFRDIFADGIIRSVNVGISDGAEQVTARAEVEL